MATVHLPHLDAERNGIDAWAATWLRLLPALALIGPGSWFVAALVRAAGIGTLDDGLDWISGPEGVIMSLGVSFFAATYVVFGMMVARRAMRSGVAVTRLGLLGLTAFGGISFFRVFMAKFTDEGLDADAMNAAFEATHIWDLAAVTNFANFAAWLIAGIAMPGSHLTNALPVSAPQTTTGSTDCQTFKNVVTLLHRMGGVMTTKKLTSREFNQDTGGAKKAANDGPVYITDRGQPSHVLLTFADYQRLAANQTSIMELLSQPPGIESIEFHAPTSPDTAEPADFD